MEDRMQDSVIEFERLRKQGAASSFASFYASSGGASAARSLAWHSSALERLKTPKERSDLMLAVETAVPGWLFAFISVPSKSDKGLSAGFSMKPVEGMRDEARVRDFMRKPKDGGPSQFEMACAAIDQWAGSASLRGLYEIFAEDKFFDQGEGQWIRAFEKIDPARFGGADLADFVACHESQVLKQDLERQCAPGSLLGWVPKKSL